MDFCKRVLLLLKKEMCQIVERNLFFPNNSSEIYICISWRHQKLLLVANQLQGGTFLFEINSKDLAISNSKS